MIQWKEEIMIERNIEKVWILFSDQHIKKIMPKVEEHTLIEKREDEAGAKHRQTYREGKRLETYNEKTAPLVSFYEKEGLLTNVNATSSDVVVQSIREKIGN